MAAQDAIQDRNNFPTLIGVSGTAGTADVTGTAQPVRIGADTATGALYVKDLSGATGTSNSLIVGGTINNLASGSVVVTTGTIAALPNVNVATGTQQTLGTVGVLNAGSVVVTTGTIAAHAITNLAGGSVIVTAGTTTVSAGTMVQASGTLTTGSVVVTLGTVVGADAAGGTSVTRPVQIAGTDAGGSVYAVLVDTSGRPQVNVVNGSIVMTTGTVATLNTVGTVGVLNAGSVVVTNGTTNVTTGSIVMTAGTVSTLNTVGTVGVLNAGSVVMTAGTVSVLNTVGTVGVVNAGSIVQTAGTVTTGSIVVTNGTTRNQMQPVNQVLTYGTLFGAAGSAFATLSAASGAGTKHVISGLSVVQESGTTDVRVLVGSAITGASVLAAGKFVPSAGLVRDFNPPIETAANTELIVHFVGAGSAFVTVQYWKSQL